MRERKDVKRGFIYSVSDCVSLPHRTGEQDSVPSHPSLHKGSNGLRSPTPAPPGSPRSLTSASASPPAPRGSASSVSKLGVAGRSYDLQERRRTGNMTGAEQARYQRIPTDESEAQTLASADLDGIKSESEGGGTCTPQASLLLCRKWSSNVKNITCFQ